MSPDWTPPDATPPAGEVPAGLDYEVVRLIGRGGYGEVWLVRDRAGVFGACKVVYRESFNNDRPYEREFAGIQKFEPVSRTNPSQLHILHVGRRDQAGYFYYILELADDANTGREIVPARYVPRTLRTDLNTRGRLPVNECIQVGLALSAALEHLHRHGLIHRDIKPGNIIFVNGVPKLADIGLVTDLDVSISYVGTEGYIPPEGPTSPQADVYGLGKVLYEISTGRDRLDFPELPTDLGEAADRQARLDFNAIVTRACQTDPRKRYASAQELHGELALLQTGGSVRHHRAVKRRWFWAAQAGIALVLLSTALTVARHFHARPALPGSPPAPLRVARIPVPGAAQLARSEAEIRDNCRPKLAGAGPEATARLAGELIQQSATIADPAYELATLRVAAGLAQEAERYDLVILACDKVAARFEMEALPLKLALLSKGALPARTPKGGASLTEACVATSFAAMSVDDYASAQHLVELAESALASSPQPHLAAEVQFLKDELARCARAYREVSRSVEILRARPGEAAANLAVGEFLCFVKNDWETGLPMLAHGNDDRLKGVLEIELNHKPDRPRDQLTAGDAWWELAAAVPAPRKLNFQRRARYWYLKAIARTRPAEKPALKERLADRLNVAPAPPAQLHIVARVDKTDHITIASDAVRWSSSRGSFNDRVNYLALGDVKPGRSQLLNNAGATRLLPEDVDFSTARLTINQMARRRARATLEVAEAHVRVVLVHSSGGLSDFDVTVTFGNPTSGP